MISIIRLGGLWRTKWCCYCRVWLILGLGIIALLPGGVNCFLVQKLALISSPFRDTETFCQEIQNEIRCWNLQRLQHRPFASTCLSDSASSNSIETPIKVNGDSHAYLMHDVPSHHGSGSSGNHVNGYINGENTNQQHPLSFVAIDALDVPMPTINGGYSHTQASRAKIGAANKGKTPWNKGRQRSEEEKARIAAGVRARNRERFLEKLKEMGMTEEEYELNKKEERRKKDAERRTRRTENGGYRPTDETRAKISKILKEKHARGEIKRRAVDPAKVRRGFTHSEETRMKISESLRQRWSKDEEYRERMTSRMKTAYSKEDVRKKVSETLKKKWQDTEFRQQMLEKMRKNRSSPEITDEYRDKISKAMKAKWQDPDYREKTLKAIANHNGISTVRSPQQRKPSKPRGSSSGEARMMKPLAPGESAKQVRKKQASKSSAARTIRGAGSDSGDSNRAVAQRTVKSKSDATVKKKVRKEKSKEPEGSVNRLREERRDLFDLLYGDEKFDDDSEDDGIVDSLLDRLPVRFDLGDEDLDSFDPYGLDDY